MFKLLFLAGIISALIGFVVIFLTYRFSLQDKYRNILVGIFFLLVGAGISWLSYLSGSPTPEITINLGLSNEVIGLFLALFLVSLFGLRAFLIIKSGLSIQAQGNFTGQSNFKARFSLIVGIILLVWALIFTGFVVATAIR